MAQKYRRPSREEIKELYKKHDYKFFEGEMSVNVFGIRRKVSTDLFDDFIGVIWKEDGKETYLISKATTDPGAYWMRHPINKNGTAILKPGQYLGAYKLGKHRGKYEALVQRKEVSVFRDKNRDTLHDFEGTEQTGVFGINIHRSNPYRASYYVDKWSAGCQVFASPFEYDAFMNVVKRSIEKYSNSITYTLFSQV